jgi:hypothetical protein
MPKHAGPTCDPVEWRRLGDYLWAGTSDEGPVGTIERGRRFYAIDPSGSIIARCHDLRTAQAALADNAEAIRATSPRGGEIDAQRVFPSPVHAA